MINDTIYAPSSAVGGAIVVIRASGPEAGRGGKLLSRRPSADPGRLIPVRVLDGPETVDDSMAVFFPAPNTYTGEDLLEIHCHGGVQTVRRILDLLGGLGFRIAEGGEFTKRAFLNGKMDLTQAEAVMDVINATAEQSRRSAIHQLHGGLGKAVSGVESLLLDALSGVDAAIDYPDEAEEDAVSSLPETIGKALNSLDSLIAGGRRGRVLRDGLRVVILGKPNVGKSSLMNALLGTDRAIVTPVAGTTRDVLDEKVSFSGVPVRLIDTAGLRDAEDQAERIGVERAKAAMESADVLLVVLDGAERLSDGDAALLKETAGDPRRIVLMNKSDLTAALAEETLAEAGVWPEELCTVSALTGTGLDALKRRILDMAAPMDGDVTAVTNERHLTLLERGRDALRAAAAARDLDCCATDLRDALHALGGITGTDVDAKVIDRIFERFCVGK